jgi:hypothetical protein
MKRWDRDISILVLDDTPEEAATEELADAVRKHSKRYGVEVQMYDRSRRGKYAHLLSEVASARGVPADTVSAAFGANSAESHTRYGVNRNLGLLLTAGSCYASADDDTAAHFLKYSEGGESASRNRAISTLRSDFEFIHTTPYASL